MERETHDLENKEVLRAYLIEHGVQLSDWGKGQAKDLDSLLLEIKEGEARIKVINDRLHRFTKGVVMKVFFRNGKELLELYEERQVFLDGRERIRSELNFSIGEKVKRGETRLQAARRGLTEELGINEEVDLIWDPGFVKISPSVTYPGLISVHEFNVFILNLPEHLFRLEGYIERQEDKTSYFRWKSFLS